MGQVKAYSKRSRQGCLTCKKRRVKCDETRPRCVRCEKLGLSCVFQNVSLTWEDEANQRGITFGRSLQARSRHKNKGSLVEADAAKDKQLLANNTVTRREQYLFLNVTIDELTSLSQGEQIKDNAVRRRKDSMDSSFTRIFEQASIPTLKSTHPPEYVATSPQPHSKRHDAFDFIFDDTTSGLGLSFDDLFLDSFAEFPISQMINAPEPSLDQCLLQLDPTEEQMMKYFIESIAPRCVCCEVKSGNHALNSYIAPELNPYLHLIIPLSFKSKLLMKTVVAASATQLSLLGQTQYQNLAQDYLQEVIAEIPKLIESKRDSDGWDDVFAIIIMLCFVEISVSCNNSWLALLNYAKSVLKGSSGVKEKILSPMGRFFVRYFISHEVMGETAWVHDSDSRDLKRITIEDDPFIEELKKDYDTKIDLVFGCSPYLISLIHRISVIGQGLDDLELESPGESKTLYTQEIMKHAEETEQMLNYLNQRLPKNSEIYFDDDERGYISTIAEIKRLSALLYLYAVVYSSPSGVNKPTKMDPHSCTKKIMELCSSLPDCYMSLLWPLFVMGLVSAVHDEQVRWFVLDNLRQMERKRRLKSVQAARKIVMNVWKEVDLGEKPSVHWRDIIKGKTTTISLA